MVAGYLVAFAAVSGAPARAFADVPPLLPIQGYLTDKQGTPIDGTKNVSFRLYANATGGAPLHEETIEVFAVDGYFTAYLGDDSGIPLDLALLRDNSHVFLGIEVESDGEGAPRLQLASTAFSAQAAYCADADNLGGKAASDFADVGHSHDWGDITGIPDAFPPLPHTHGDGDIACYADLGAEGYLDNNNPNDLLTQAQGDGRYAGKAHGHDAGEIQSGTLSDARFSAYADLAAEGRLGNSGPADIMLQGQSDMRFVNTGEGNSITNNMIVDGTIQTADLAPNSVTMDRTSAPIGAYVNSSTLSSTATTSYIMSGQSFTPDSNGTCIVTASVRANANSPTGYYYSYPVYQIGAGTPSAVNNTTISYASPTVLSSSYQTNAITGVLPVASGSTYQFGCAVYISSGSTFAGNTFTCISAWVCN